jgi:restriction system protein
MKLRMAENSLFAVLLRSRWWISFVIAAALALVAAALLPERFKIVGVVSALPFVVIGCIAAWRQAKQPSPAMIRALASELSASNWNSFSQRLQSALSQDGYQLTRGPEDPVDFELRRQGEHILVHARRWKSTSVGVDTLTALSKARDARQATGAIVITLGELSEAAVRQAREQGISVWRINELARVMLASTA